MVLRNAHYEQGTILGGYKQAILPLDWSRTQFWHRLMSQTSFLQRLLHAAVNTPLAGFPQVYALAVQLPRIVVTYNAKDFRRLAHNNKEAESRTFFQRETYVFPVMQNYRDPSLQHLYLAITA